MKSIAILVSLLLGPAPVFAGLADSDQTLEQEIASLKEAIEQVAAGQKSDGDIIRLGTDADGNPNQAALIKAVSAKIEKLKDRLAQAKSEAAGLDETDLIEAQVADARLDLDYLRNLVSTSSAKLRERKLIILKRTLAFLENSQRLLRGENPRTGPNGEQGAEGRRPDADLEPATNKALGLLPPSLLSGDQDAAYDGSAALAEAAFVPASTLPGTIAARSPMARLKRYSRRRHGKQGDKDAPGGGAGAGGKGGQKPGDPVCFDPGSLDRSVDPCVDFYQYSCGSWIKNNPIPPDQSRWVRFNELAERNRAVLRDILQEAAAAKDSKDANRRKMGDFFAACMDEDGVNAKGLDPIKPALDRIAALAGKADLAGEVARLHLSGVPALFEFGAEQDYEDAEKTIAAVDQGGLSLPDRDYYLLDKFKDERKAYQEHVQKMFVLAGDPAQKAAAEAASVVAFETSLASASLTRVQRRDPANVHHKKKLTELSALTPSFDWKTYRSGAGSPDFQDLDVAVPGFFAGVEALLASASLDDWKTYLRWQVLHAKAPWLPKAFVEENFAFYGKRLAGQKEMKARWKRCVELADASLRDAVGKAYVDKTFGTAGQERTLQMVREIYKAMGDDIDELPWMSTTTKKLAQEKLKAVTEKIGYPEKWRDYSTLDILPGDAMGNMERAAAYEHNREMGKIGKPVDKKDWWMTPPTVNAYYDPEMNNINFPAGILQPPFFSVSADTAANLGGIGAVIGHELTHGFDDQGRQYNGHGDLKDWWTPEDAKNFESRAQGLVDQYSAFVVLKDTTSAGKDVKINGKLTLGENTADNGGLRLAYRALMSSQNGQPGEKIDGFTSEQRFFISFGQIWCGSQTEQEARKRAVTDPHSPGKFRVNGTVSNMPEFRQAFSCQEDAPMVRKSPARVW